MIKIAKCSTRIQQCKLFLSRLPGRGIAEIKTWQADIKSFREFLKEEGLVITRQDLVFYLKELLRLIILTPLFLLWSILFLPLLADYLDIYEVVDITQKLLCAIICIIFWLIQVRIFTLSLSLTIFVMIIFPVILYYNYFYGPSYRYNLYDYLLSWDEFIQFLDCLKQELLELLQINSSGQWPLIA